MPVPGIETPNFWLSHQETSLKTSLKLLGLAVLILATQSFTQAASLLVSYSSLNGGGVEKFSLTPQSAGTIFDLETDAITSLTVAGNTAYWVSGNAQIYSDSLNDVTGGAAKTALPSIPFAGVTVSDLAVDPATNQYLVGWIAPGRGWFIAQYPLAPAGAFSVSVNATATIQGLSIVGGKAYWIEGINVWSQNLDGTDKTRVQNFSLGGVELNDLAVDSASQTYLLSAVTSGLPPLIARYPRHVECACRRADPARPNSSAAKNRTLMPGSSPARRRQTPDTDWSPRSQTPCGFARHPRNEVHRSEADVPPLP